MKQDEVRRVIHGKRILALDPGMKRTGIAMTDPLHITVSPVAVIEMNDEAVSAILRIAIEHGVGAVIVGIPERTIPSAMTLFAEEFAQTLEQAIVKHNTDIAVLRYDESFSTRHAFQAMSHIGMKKKKRQEKGQKDVISACVILRNFLEEFQ